MSDGAAERSEAWGGPQAAAVLDIGGDVGAVLVLVPAPLAGTEIQLYDGQGRALTHTGVHLREVAGRGVGAGVFPAVPSGDYAVDAGGSRPVPVSVTGGQVSTVDESAGSG